MLPKHWLGYAAQWEMKKVGDWVILFILLWLKVRNCCGLQDRVHAAAGGSRGAILLQLSWGV